MERDRRRKEEKRRGRRGRSINSKIRKKEENTGKVGGQR